MQAPFPEGLGRYGRGQEREDVGDGEAPEDGTMTWCTHSVMANVAHVLPTQVASKCDGCKDFPHTGYMETYDEDPNDQWRPNRLKVCITQDWYNKIDLTNQFARRIRLVIKCYFRGLD
eukprot:COSAG02_NODE_20721_length_817_cov_3.766017_1_plen_118_part_00